MRLSKILTVVLCDGERVCNRCQTDDTRCDYNQDAGHQWDKRSTIALLEAQNKQLKETVQTLYEYIRTGHNIPVLPGRSSGDDRPLLHDIVEYVNTPPVRMETSTDQLQQQIPWLGTTSTLSLPQPQPETSSYLSFAATESQRSNFMAPSMQPDLPLTEYNLAQVDHEFLGSSFDLQEFLSFAEADPVEAARSRRWL
ncbi:hypothetical protein COCSADRAFT_159425 [Bipolaris sorokiniana ND90Pr]|uniref:Zn(2)-C6 fungal-type domain-containing protein n=1 Tax=Cochliobolus sativus (strain ND90Pr / ATCC 201652) TaxID=665912 RepID=M2SEU0_COCSN|nr:uncharacterized protein COCSADRAFT_159425 [Bipolaris sorokiniana ND90Pr]EMD65818.1 hypothetical protein COCSADRAFT_159425 [Bipolaris sorokiniana ND90Pr]